MSIEEIVAEYHDMRPRYLELGTQIKNFVKESDLPVEDLSEITGWQVATIEKIRAEGKPRSEHPTSKVDRIPNMLSETWEEAEIVIPRIAAKLGWKEATVKSVLRKMHEQGIIDAKGRKTRYMGKPGMVRTHYRRVPRLLVI